MIRHQEAVMPRWVAWPERICLFLCMPEGLFFLAVVLASDSRYLHDKLWIFVGMFVWTVLPLWVLLRAADYLFWGGPARRRKAYTNIRFMP
jgi:hypothetical protein